MKVLQPSLSTRRRLNSEIDTLTKCLNCSFFRLVATVCNRIALCIPLNRIVKYASILKTLLKAEIPLLIKIRSFLSEGRSESCESKVANLLASMSNLPKGDFDGKIGVLLEIIELQQKQIQDLEQAFSELPEVFELKEKMLTVEEAEK